MIGGNIVVAPGSIDSKIEIVWPHANKPVSQATLANVTAAIFERGTLTSVSPNTSNGVNLWRALDNGVGQKVSTGVKRLITAGKLSYPVWDFNDVDVSAARDGSHRYYFWTTVDGQRANSSVWSHGVDARTYFPKQDQPSTVLTSAPSSVDAKIEIVWPHDNLPVARAKLANIGVDLFAHGTLQSVPTGYSRSVQLFRSDNGGPLMPVGNGDLVLQTRGGQTFPTWQFNDVDISAAQDAHNRIYFQVVVMGVTTYSNVWTHGVDARTFFPRQDVPTAVR